MGRFVALLRGINVGGHNKVPMADLRDTAAALGFTSVATYIQSGNLIFDASDDEPSLVVRLEKGIAARYGFEVPVVIRTARQLRAIAAEHPLAGGGSDPRFLMVAFLDRPPEVAVEEAIDPAEHAPDRYLLDGREMYLDYPKGSGRSKLDHSLIERRLEVRATVRNWNTVTKLAAMLDAG
jgi:uncharacterized protein (DUF1697 family)